MSDNLTNHEREVAAAINDMMDVAITGRPIQRCTDCRAPLRTTVAQLFGVCDPCRDKWTALAVVGTPSRIDLKDAARDAAHGASVEDELREVGPEPSDEPEPVKCVRCEEMVTQYDVNQHGQPLCFECCEDMERWDFR